MLIRYFLLKITPQNNLRSFVYLCQIPVIIIFANLQKVKILIYPHSFPYLFCTMCIIEMRTDRSIMHSTCVYMYLSVAFHYVCIIHSVKLSCTPSFTVHFGATLQMEDENDIF